MAEVLVDPHWSAAFLAFARSEYSDEFAEFWTDVEQLRQCMSAAVQHAADHSQELRPRLVSTGLLPRELCRIVSEYGAESLPPIDAHILARGHDRVYDRYIARGAVKEIGGQSRVDYRLVARASAHAEGGDLDDGVDFMRERLVRSPPASAPERDWLYAWPSEVERKRLTAYLRESRALPAALRPSAERLQLLTRLPTVFDARQFEFERVMQTDTLQRFIKSLPAATAAPDDSAGS